MTFAKPEMLWLLLATAPLLAWFLTWAWRKRQQLIGKFVQSRLLAQLTVGVSPWRLKTRLVLLGLAAVLILLALARPQFGFAWEEVRQRGLDIFVAVDTSRSMLAADVTPNRLARTKLAALDLQQLAQSDRLALIAFAGNAFLQCPLTLDDNAFQQSVNLLEVGLLPQGGTAIGEAIQVALAALKDSGDNYKVMVLFTDGEDHDSNALEAAIKAGEAGLRIFTVGVGTATGDRIRLVDDQGRSSYVLGEDGNPVVSKLNQELLRDIAAKTGGDYLPLMGANPMQALYDARLAPLPKSDLSTRLLRQYHERYQWPLGLAILLLATEMFLPQRKRVTRPEPGPPPQTEASTRHAGLTKSAALLLAIVSAAPALASSRSALKAYEQGRFAEAQQEYQRLVEKRPDDARLQYNAGTAALRAGELTEATNRLGTATRSNDPALLKNVYYNLGNALFRLGERADDPTGSIADWEQSLRHYDSALELDPKDADARFNRELVSQRIELLKQQMAQQQQQQQQQPQDQSQDQSKQDQQPSSEPSPPSNDSEQSKPQPQEQQPTGPPEAEPKPQDQAGNRDQSGQDSASKEGADADQPPQPDSPKPAPEQPAEPPKGTPEPADGASSSREGGGSDAADAARAAALGQMTPEQARRLLDSVRSEERAWQPVPPPRSSRNASRRIRDW